MKLHQIASSITARRPRVELSEGEWLDSINAFVDKMSEDGIMDRIRLTPICDIPIMWDSYGTCTLKNRMDPENKLIVTGNFGDDKADPKDKPSTSVNLLDTRMLFPIREVKYAMHKIDSRDDNSMHQRFFGLNRKCKWCVICVQSELINWGDERTRRWIPRRVHVSSSVYNKLRYPPFFAQSGATGREFLSGMRDAINSRVEEMRERARLLSEYTNPVAEILRNTQ
jgi:hypothetical protein